MRVGAPTRWLSLISSTILAVTAQSVPPSNLDLKSLQNIAIGGDFDAISVYSFIGQQEGISGNGTQSVLSQMPNGMYDILASTDAYIEGMCPFVLKNGTLAGLILGGNFTSVGGVGAQGVAFIDANTLQVTAHEGIQGSVTSVLCDSDTNTVYIGGSFEASTSSNAISWIAEGRWANLPFAGFDAPVTSIAKAPNGHIVFGGSFSGLKNGSSSSVTAPKENQVINLVTANITSVANATSGSNIVCPSNSSDGSNWLLQDRTPGSWTASLRYGFEPARLRLYNTQGDHGTKTWRFTALPNTGIMNFTYTDPVTGNKAFCDARCPLAQNESTPYQDFHFVNTVGMNSFRIDVSDWYGQGGGLAGIELFQNDTFVYAIEAFNEPTCLASSSTVARSSATGAWFSTPSRDSVADYLSVVVGPTTLDSTSIVFEPDVEASGNYSVVVYTPGCRQDSSCSARAIVNVTGTLTNDGNTTFSTQLFQTNDFDKYDNVFQGKIDAADGAFRPAVTITPSGLQDAQYIVASRVRFSGNPSTGGLNGLFDYDPSKLVVDTDFSKSAINNAGTQLKPNARILCLAKHNDTLFSAGVFSDDEFDNIMSFANNEASSLAQSGLNAAVIDMYSDDTLEYLYVGGNFSGTSEQGGPNGMNNAAAYHLGDNVWTALGAGLDGEVTNVVPMQMNISNSANETVITFGGNFQNINGVNGAPSTPANGFAIWVPSQNAWLETLDIPKSLLTGQLYSHLYMPNGTWLGAGTLASLGQAMSDVAALAANSDSAQIQQLPLTFVSTSRNSNSNSSLSKRAEASNEVNGVTTGLWLNNGLNVTVLAGHFTARVNSTTVQNLLFLDGDNGTLSGLPTGIDDNSTFYALETQSNLLFAGGSISGQLNDVAVEGLVVYDINAVAYRTPQPAALSGSSVVVNTIVAQSGTSNVYVGGSFETTAQGLACQSVCMYDTSADIWSSVGGGLDGTVSALYFTDRTHMLAAGNFTGPAGASHLAVYDTKEQTWAAYNNVQLPGPASSFTSSDSNGNQFWVAGTANNGSTYLIMVDGGNLNPVPDAFGDGSVIYSMEVMQTSKSHGSSRYLDQDKDLLVMGHLNLTGFGGASSAIFNGTTFTPFLLSVSSTGQSGTIRSLISKVVNPALTNSRRKHSRGIAILVAFCAALGTIFLIVLLGMVLNRIQRKRAGYSSLPSVPYQDKNSNISRVPPERLFGTLGQRSPGVPAV